MGDPSGREYPGGLPVGQPSAFIGDSDRLAALANALGSARDALEAKLARYADKQFMYLARSQTPDQARRVLDLGIVGVRSQREYRRFYPRGRGDLSGGRANQY